MFETDNNVSHVFSLFYSESIIKGLSNSEEGSIQKADEYLGKIEGAQKKNTPVDNTGICLYCSSINIFQHEQCQKESIVYHNSTVLDYIRQNV